MESNLSKQKTSAENGEVRKSINASFQAEIDAWVQNEQPNDETFVLGTTGDVLQGLGAIESDIYMLSEKINEILNKHPKMTIKEIKKIPQILENPILILKSQNDNIKINSRLVIFGNIKTEQGDPVLSVLDLRPIENNLTIEDMQKVTSSYIKDFNPIDFIKGSQVVFADKNKTTKLLRTIGFQTPIALQQSGYIGNISYKGPVVNIEGKKFNEVFIEKTDNRKSLTVDSEGNTLTEAQQEYFKDSKVRDDNGRLLVLHRGSPEDFGTVFKFLVENLNSKDQPNTFGFFFTDNFDTAEYYSKARGNEGDIKTVYLNLKHPLDLTSLGISSSEKEFYHLLEENGVITGRSRYKQDYKPVGTRFDKKGESLRRNIESAGFDGVVYHDWGENKSTYVAFEPNQIKLTTNENPTESEDIRYSKSVDIYTEEQYNNFGWVSANNLWTPQERETLLSRYADFKHNKDKYPVTRLGEAVIHSFDLPNIIAYIKGTIKNPQITKIVRIELDDYNANEAKGWILENERQQISLPYQTIEELYGKESIGLQRKRDFASFQEYRREQERKLGTEDLPSDRNLQVGTRDAGQVYSISEAEQLDSAFSMPEDERKSLNIDLTTLPDSELSDAVENETITREQAEQELMRRYGKIPNSFKPKQNIVLTREETEKEGFATSAFVDNVIRNGRFDANMTDEQKAEILRAAKTHKIITDKAAIQKVKTALNDNYEKAVAEWQAYINVNNKSIKQIGKNEIALGQQLMQHAAENGNVADTVKYLAELTEAATRAGQVVQAFSMLKKMGGILSRTICSAFIIS